MINPELSRRGDCESITIVITKLVVFNNQKVWLIRGWKLVVGLLVKRLSRDWGLLAEVFGIFVFFWIWLRGVLMIERC